MKPKEQKRLEAIERLERMPRWNSNFPHPTGWTQQTWGRRLEEAARLRRRFGLPSRDEASPNGRDQ